MVFRELLKNTQVILRYQGITDICKVYWITGDIPEVRGRKTPYPTELWFSYLSSSISNKKILDYLRNLKITDTNSKQKLLA